MSLRAAASRGRVVAEPCAVSRADASPVRPERGRSACATRDRYSISRLQKASTKIDALRTQGRTCQRRRHDLSAFRLAVGILPLLSLTRRGARKRMTTSIYQLWHGATPPLYVRRAFCVNEMVFAAKHGYAYHRTSTRAATRPTSGNRSAAWERVPLLLDALARHRRSGTDMEHCVDGRRPPGGGRGKYAAAAALALRLTSRDRGTQ